jgi:hypothetical protein
MDIEGEETHLTGSLRSLEQPVPGRKDNICTRVVNSIVNCDRADFDFIHFSLGKKILKPTSSQFAAVGQIQIRSILPASWRAQLPS